MTWTTVARRVGGFLVGLLAVAAVPLAGTALIKRNKELGLKLFAPYIAFTRLYAGKRFAPLAMLEHRGRKSTRLHHPVVVSPLQRRLPAAPGVRRHGGLVPQRPC